MMKGKTYEMENPLVAGRKTGNPPLVELMLRSCRFNHISNYCWGILCHDESSYNYTYVGDIFTHVHVAVLFFDRKRCHI